MTEASQTGLAVSLPTSGMTDARPRNPLRERLAKIKREAIDAAMDKSESWTTKVVNGESGVRLDDLPRLLELVGLKPVDVTTVAVDPAIAQAYETIVARATQGQSLLLKDAE